MGAVPEVKIVVRITIVGQAKMPLSKKLFFKSKELFTNLSCGVSFRLVGNFFSNSFEPIE